MPTIPWSVSKFKLWAEAKFSKTNKDGSTTTDLVEFNVIQFAASFELNNIPSATILISVGRRADDPLNKIAQIHKRINDLKLIIPITVKMQATSISGTPGPEAWPKGEFTVFEGLATGAGLRKTSQGMEYSFFLTHWLSNLNFSSAITRSTHPVNPNQVSFSSAFFTPAGGGQGEKHMESTTLAVRNFNGATVTQDFWGKTNAGLKQWFLELSDRDQLNFLVPANPFGIADEKNSEAIEAIKRFEPNFESEKGYTFGVPLRMRFDSGIDEDGKATNSKVDDQVNIAADSISKAIAKESFETMSGFTLWDKLIQLSSSYCFAIVPMVDRALIVPLTPSLRGKAFKTIWGTQYERIEQSNIMPRPLRGVVVYRGRPAGMAGGMGNHNTLPPNDLASGQFYDAAKVNPERRKGLILFKEAPTWLADVVPRNSYAPPSKIAVGTAVAPDPDEEADPLKNATKSAAEVMSVMNPMLKRYAKALYLLEILRGRSGVISGKLRFDIAPGSCVKIEGVEERGIIGSKTGFEEFSFATVIGVTVAINAESNAASTSFQVTFIRNETENTDNTLTTDANPLWAHNDSKWYGAPLVTEKPFTTADDDYLETNQVKL